MGVVDDEHGVMLAREASDLGERRDIAVHGEHALGQDEFRPLISLILTQKRAEMGGVAMAIADLARAGRGAAEMDARVIEPVGENERLGAEHAPVEQRLQHRGIGLEARGHDQRRRLLLQRRDLGLDTCEQIEVAGDETRGAGAHAMLFRPRFRPLDQRRMEAQGEIVVAGEIDVGLACRCGWSSRRAPRSPVRPRRRPSRSRASR